EAAYPWSADWYRARVEAALGSHFHDRYRLWFVENAMHTTQGVSPSDPRPVATTRVVSYQGVLQQALRDVAAWVEKGVAPPESSAYRVEDGQVIVPPSAAARKGVQPVVTLTANGGERVEVRVGEPVSFEGQIETPPGAGMVVAAEWDFEGAGDYPVISELSQPAASVSVKQDYAFTQPGIYFPTLRAASQRQGDPTAYGRARNLSRVRVVVT
ncbi:MAG TPA: hypothetical protein VGI30_07070, partial [Caulobacteraceae bacterium]